MGKRQHPSSRSRNLGEAQSRFVRRDGKTDILRKGSSHSLKSDLYHWLLTLSWPQFMGLIGLVYVASNTLFAFAYLAQPNSIHNAQPGSFLDAFFFSVQTMATIGYGALYPRTPYANAIVALEALVGLLGVAMVTGLAFARFSTPKAKVMFSDIAVIAPHNGVPTLMFRTANRRRNSILEAQIQVTLARNEMTKEGEFIRRLHDIHLIRSRTPIFSLSWTVMHPIDENSLLSGATPESLVQDEVELIVTLTGIDETVSQTIHARYSYVAEEILWNMRFVDILGKTSDGRRYVDYRCFHDVIPL
jgi:inward rectifier potassium channel